MPGSQFVYPSRRAAWEAFHGPALGAHTFGWHTKAIVGLFHVAMDDSGARMIETIFWSGHQKNGLFVFALRRGKIERPDLVQKTRIWSFKIRTSPGAPGGLHTRGSLPLAQPKSRPLGRPFAPRGSPARGLAWRSPPWGADLPPPVPACVPAPQFPQQSSSPSPSPAPLFEYTQRPPASPTR